MSDITKNQKTVIWTIVRKNNIEEEMFRDMLQRTYGTRSTRRLTESQAASVINTLKAYTGEKYKPHTRTWGITDRQFWKARALAEELGWDKPQRLDGLVKKMFYGKNRLELLNKTEATKLIVALEKMVDEVERGEKVYA
ncbi:hypothetical protein ES705_25387 [subsurface metagenome]